MHDGAIIVSGGGGRYYCLPEDEYRRVRRLLELILNDSLTILSLASTFSIASSTALYSFSLDNPRPPKNIEYYLKQPHIY